MQPSFTPRQNHVPSMSPKIKGKKRRQEGDLIRSPVKTPHRNPINERKMKVVDCNTRESTLNYFLSTNNHLSQHEMRLLHFVNPI